MPPDASGSRAKPTTRSSIRQSLNFASVGKAFADVMNKESRDSDRPPKKLAKDSHRSSGVGLKPAAPRPSLDSRPSPPPAKRSNTPDSKTITARRRSSLAAGSISNRHSVDDPSGSSRVTPPAASALGRASSLRPRPGTSSNLPKYRPKSIIENGNGKKPGSPAPSRKRPSISDDEERASSNDMKVDHAADSSEKQSRPISPLPQRAAFKANLTNIAPSTTPTIPRSNAPSSLRKASPNHHVKAVKASDTNPRPSSSSSSSSSFSPRTPKASAAKPRSAKTKEKPESSGESSSTSAISESPLVRHVRQRSKPDTPESSSTSGLPESPLVRHVRQRSKPDTPTAHKLGNMSNISEADSDDEGDVMDMLAPVASPGAPTPAIPRLLPSRTRTRLVPATPTKPLLSSSKFDPPQAASTPPKHSDSPPFLRPNPSPASERSLRGGSILSWEQLASEASRTISVDELGSMLSETDAPFQPGPLSPMHTGTDPMHLNIPPSPAGLSTFNSPSGYGSISQVLLPNVTPSPAAFPRQSHSQRHQEDSEIPAVDTAIATLLRLQLSSAENTAKERLMRLQVLEEEVHNLKQARAHDAEELSHQISILEAQLKGSFEARERTEGEQVAYTASLEEQLRSAQMQHEQAVREAAEEARQSAEASLRSALAIQNRKINTVCAASLAAREWKNVQEQCVNELDVVAADKETLSLLLAELDLVQRQMLM